MDGTIGVPEGQEIMNRVFIGGLARDTSELELENFFSNFGAVSDVRIVCDRKTGLNKGYGFVTFSDPDTRDSLVQKGSIEYKARKLRLRKAVKKETGGQFSSSLNCNFTQEEGPVVGNQLVLIPANETPSYTSPVYFQAAAPNYTMSNYIPMPQYYVYPGFTFYYV